LEFVIICRTFTIL